MVAVVRYEGRHRTKALLRRVVWMAVIHFVNHSWWLLRVVNCYHHQKQTILKYLVSTWSAKIHLKYHQHRNYSIFKHRIRQSQQQRITYTNSRMSLQLPVSSSVSSLKKELPKVIIIAGPTASGKSDVAAIICDILNGIIVSADSVQVYDKVQIGANKPSAEELQRTPHLLVNLIPATKGNNKHHTTSDNYNAAEWRRDAIYCIQNLIHSTGTSSLSSYETIAELDNLSQQTILEDLERQKDIRFSIEEAKETKKKIQSTKGTNRSTTVRTTSESYLPVVVGGTMMYLQWLVHGRPDAIRPTETALQQAKQVIEMEYQVKNDWDSAVTFVSDKGYVFQQQVQKLSKYDWYRLRRILEVAITVQELQIDTTNQQTQDIYSGIREGGLSSFGYDVRCFFLCPDDRMKHTKIVDTRCEAMIVRGLLRETTDLVLANEMPDMATKAIGYRQSIDYLQRDDPTDNDSESFMDYIAKFTAATRQYSKRQMQWFRRDNDFLFVGVPIDLPKSERIQHVADKIMQYVALSKDEFVKELHAASSDSQQVRTTNAQQAKTMRTYQLQKQILLENTMELQNAMAEADACTRRFQKMKRVCVHENDTIDHDDTNNTHQHLLPVDERKSNPTVS